MAIFLMGLSLGCAESSGEAPRSDGSSAPFDRSTAARVDGVPISVEEVARVAAGAGLEPEAALEVLIDAELLAAEADRRGLESRAEVRSRLRRARVQALLDELGAADPMRPAEAQDQARFGRLRARLGELRERHGVVYEQETLRRVLAGGSLEAL